jgi:hypothetical protein
VACASCNPPAIPQAFCGQRKMCQTVTLETGHNADDLAEMHLNIAEANLLKDKVVNEADRQEIRRNLREGFGKFLAGNVSMCLPRSISTSRRQVQNMLVPNR